MTRIAIVGGGPGGLMAANCLIEKSNHDLDITIFEASFRLGGKVLTKQFQTHPSLYEAGVSELYLMSAGDDPLFDLLESFGFTFSDMEGDITILEDKIVRSVDDLKKVFGQSCWRQVKDFIKQGRSFRTPDAFAGAGWAADNQHPWAEKSLQTILAGLDETARRYIEVSLKSDLATETSLTNGTYGFDNYLVGDPKYCTLYTIDGGIEKMIDALHQHIMDRATIHLNAPVKHITKLHNDKYQVVTQDDEFEASDEFDAVLICLPQHWLSSVIYGGDLAQVMVKHASHYSYPAHYLKVAVLFSQPFWSNVFDEESYINLDAFGGCCVYDETSRYPAGQYGTLNWLLAGSNAEALNNSSDAYILKRVLESLPIDLAQDAKKYFIEGHVHRWIGTVSGQPGGHPILDVKEKHIPAPKKHPKFIIVGDYLFDSTLNGLLDSADFATTTLLETLDKLSPAYRENPGVSYPVSSKVKYMMKHRR